MTASFAASSLRARNGARSAWGNKSASILTRYAATICTVLLSISLVISPHISRADTPPLTHEQETQVEKLKADAKVLWADNNFVEYTKTCEQLEKLVPGFSWSFNVALGLFRQGLSDAALAKILDIEANQQPLTESLIKHLEVLRTDIEKHNNFLQYAQSADGGTASASTGTARFPADVQRDKNEQRTASQINLKPEEAAEFLKQQYRIGLVNNGYAVQPDKVGSVPIGMGATALPVAHTADDINAMEGNNSVQGISAETTAGGGAGSLAGVTEMSTAGTAIFASKLPNRKTASKENATLAKDSHVQKAPVKVDEYKNVKAELAATPAITTPGPPGDLRVWIGDEAHKANFPAEMVSASAIIQTSIKPQTVLVTPNASAFNIEPTNKCQRFDPTGTTVNFQLTPKFERNETYPVGARIEVFDQEECRGDPIPKAAADIQVKVEVRIPPDDIYKLIRENISNLIAGLLALIVAFILFKARKFLKEKFGFEDKEK